jgi:3',5'-cyclic AMP phosphodiesterase CpdA
VRTAIVSDLHLGSHSGKDLLRDLEIRRALLEEIESADRLVLLGDVIELLELPLAAVLAVAKPFFEELGEAMAGRKVILVPGNHDYRLAEPLLEQVAVQGRRLGLEQRVAPVGRTAKRIATWLGDSELEIAYPGVWLRDDVYATHGHYMDCHRGLLRMECIAPAVVMRAFGSLPNLADPAEYERVLRPIYRFGFSLAQVGFGRCAMRLMQRTWRTMFGRKGRGAHRTVFSVGVSAGVWSLNRLLRAEFCADPSGTAIYRGSIDGGTQLVERLQVRAAHTIMGHSHWGGPGWKEAEWLLPDGGYLYNTGNWVFDPALHDARTPPGANWPGTVIWLEDTGSPLRTNLLSERPLGELAAAVARIAPGEGSRQSVQAP